MHTIKIQNSDADWDDEEQRVKVSFDVGMVAAAGTVVLGNVGFQVVILGAISS